MFGGIYRSTGDGLKDKEQNYTKRGFTVCTVYSALLQWLNFTRLTVMNGRNTQQRVQYKFSVAKPCKKRPLERTTSGQEWPITINLKEIGSEDVDQHRTQSIFKCWLNLSA